MIAFAGDLRSALKRSAHFNKLILTAAGEEFLIADVTESNRAGVTILTLHRLPEGKGEYVVTTHGAVDEAAA